MEEHKKLLLLLVHIYGTLVSITFTNARCTDEDITYCVDTLVLPAGLDKDYRNIPIFFPNGAATQDFHNLCGARNGYEICLNRFVDNCTDSVRYSLRGIADAIIFICSNGETTYVTNAPCLGSDSNQEFSAICLYALYAAPLTDATWCQKVNNYMGCIAKGALEACGGTARSYQYGAISRMLQDQATEIHSCELRTGVYNCTNEGVSVCVDYFINRAGKKKDDYGVPLPFSVENSTEAVNDMCKYFEDFTTCTDYDNRCTDLNTQKTLEGILDVYRFICAEKPAFMEQNGCLGGDSNVLWTRSCKTKLQKDLTQENWCHKVNVYHGCLYHGAKAYCTTESAEYQDKISKMLLAKQAQRYRCAYSNIVYSGSIRCNGCIVLNFVVLIMIKILASCSN